MTPARDGPAPAGAGERCFGLFPFPRGCKEPFGATGDCNALFGAADACEALFRAADVCKALFRATGVCEVLFGTTGLDSSRSSEGSFLPCVPPAFDAPRTLDVPAPFDAPSAFKLAPCLLFPVFNSPPGLPVATADEIAPFEPEPKHLVWSARSFFGVVGREGALGVAGCFCELLGVSGSTSTVARGTFEGARVWWIGGDGSCRSRAG